MSRIGIIDIAIMLLSLAMAFIVFMPMSSSDKFDYDEADYMVAVSKGLVANYLDRPSISFFDFIKMGFQKGMQVQERANLSETIRRSGDIPFYRHYHGPFYYYYLSLMKRVVGKNEKRIRQATLIFFLLGYIIVYLGSFFLDENNARFAALISANLFLFSPALLDTSLTVSPHSMFLPISMVSLLLMAKIIQSDDIHQKGTYFFWLLVCISLAFLILENASFLAATLLLSCFLHWSSFKDSFHNKNASYVLAGSAGVFLAIILLCWPGGLFKLTLLKNYLFHFFHSIGRANPQSNLSVIKIWENLFAGSPLDLVIVIFSFVAGFYYMRKKNLAYFFPLLVFSSLIFLSSILNKSLNFSAKYISSALPPLYLVTGIICSHLLVGNFRKISVAVLTIILTLAIYQNFYYFIEKQQVRATNQIKPMDSLLTYLEKNHTVNHRVLLPINFVPIVHYYHPSLDIFAFIYGSSDEQIVRKVNECNCDGLLYVGTSDQKIDKLIQSVGPFRKDILAAAEGKVAFTFFRRVPQAVN